MAAKGRFGSLTAPCTTGSPVSTTTGDQDEDGSTRRAVYDARVNEDLQVVELLLEEEAGDRRGEELRDAGGRGVCAMGSAEGVIDVHVERGSELLGELLVILLLLGIEAHVLEEAVLAILITGDVGSSAFFINGISIFHTWKVEMRANEAKINLQVLDDCGSLLANAILGHHTGLANELGKAASAGSEGVLVLRPTLGTAKMRRNSNASTVVEEVLDGGNRGTDASVIGDFLALQGHVQVATDENL
jgi:hypothetical protein